MALMLKYLVFIVTVILLTSNNSLAIETCIASWYRIGEASQPGTKTASGIPLDDRKLTAAHKSLVFGTQVRVTNLSNNKFVDVVITDRGPYKKGRCIDLSLKAAETIDILKSGLARVLVEEIKIYRLE